MPVAPLFKDRYHFLTDGKLKGRDAYIAFEAPLSVYTPPPVDTKDLTIDGNGGPIKARLYRPSSATGELGVLIWYHGGAFLFGDIDMNEAHIVALELAHRAGIAVLTVDYRLCTETVRFPAPQDDGISSLRWVAANAKSNGIDAKRIFIGGISAGAALAASVATHDRDSGENLLAGALLNCPDLHQELPPLTAEIIETIKEVPASTVLDGKAVAQFRLGQLDPKKPVETWWFAGDVEPLSGLCPMQIIDCQYDPLRASGEKYARDLKAAGVEVESLMQEGVPHAHINRYPADCPEMDETLNNMVRWIQQH